MFTPASFEPLRDLGQNTGSVWEPNYEHVIYDRPKARCRQHPERCIVVIGG